MKSEFPSWSTIPGENPFASDFSGGEDDDGTYLCPASAIKHPIPHLVYTSAYEGNDCTGGYIGPTLTLGTGWRCVSLRSCRRSR